MHYYDPSGEPQEFEFEPQEPGDASDLDYEEMPCTDGIEEADDARWEAFIPDDDEFDPLPDPGDFWIESWSRLPNAA